MRRQYWLEYRYTTPRLEEQLDYVGPFSSRWAASRHKGKWGPVTSHIVTSKSPDTPMMSPVEHVEYMKRRA
jgi:hypothetical protein